jgi:aldehyde:ferredoxin oxidoreductase
MVKIKVDGYAGKYLRVDLTSEQLSTIVFDEATLRKYLGGTGIGTKILYDEVPPQSEWSDPVNRLIIATGPLGGTIMPGSGTISLVTKGALTNGATSVQANGCFGAFLKFAGYDGIIVQGVAKRWLYLYIADHQVELRNSNHLLGNDTYETYDMLRDELEMKKGKMSVISIGPAGEHLVRFAGVFVDKGHSASHNGSGAIMGSKKLKAIVTVRGNSPITIKDVDRLKTIKTNGGLATVGGVHRSLLSGGGTLPIKNYTTNIWPIEKELLTKFSDKYIRTNFKSRPSPCWACSANHCNMMTIPEGVYKGDVVEEPEYEQMAAWGPVIDNRNAASAFMLSGLCDKLGFENNEAGWLISWIMECYEKGYLSKDAIDGLELSWGNIENVKQLLFMIAHRQGFGNLLADGVMRASQKIGGKAAKCAIYTKKGNSPRGHDHRTAWGELFDTVVSNTGTIETHRSMMDPKAGNEPGHPIETSTAVAITKGLMALEDSAVTCRFHTGMNAILISTAVSAVTGWDFTPEEAKTVGVRVVNLMKCFNIRCGIKKEHDYPSERYGSTPIDGPSKGIAIMPKWDAMLENYYSLMGWDIATGKPLPSTLKQLNLDDIIDDIW